MFAFDVGMSRRSARHIVFFLFAFFFFIQRVAQQSVDGQPDAAFDAVTDQQVSAREALRKLEIEDAAIEGGHIHGEVFFGERAAQELGFFGINTAFTRVNVFSVTKKQRHTIAFS